MGLVCPPDCRPGTRALSLMYNRDGHAGDATNRTEAEVETAEPRARRSTRTATEARGVGRGRGRGAPARGPDGCRVQRRAWLKLSALATRAELALAAPDRGLIEARLNRVEPAVYEGATGGCLPIRDAVGRLGRRERPSCLRQEMCAGVRRSFSMMMRLLDRRSQV